MYEIRQGEGVLEMGWHSWIGQSYRTVSFGSLAGIPNDLALVNARNHLPAISSRLVAMALSVMSPRMVSSSLGKDDYSRLARQKRWSQMTIL